MRLVPKPLEEVRAYAAHGEAGRPYRKRYWVNATSGSTANIAQTMLAKNVKMVAQ